MHCPTHPVLTQVAARPETPEPTTATLIFTKFVASVGQSELLKTVSRHKHESGSYEEDNYDHALRGCELRGRGSLGKDVYDVGIESIVRLASWIPHSCRSWSAPLPLTLSLTLYFRGLLYNFMVP